MHDDSVALTIHFSDDSNYLVTGAHDGVVRIWDISNGTPTCTRRFQGHIDWARAAVFAPEGKLIASGSDDGMVCLWNVADPDPDGELLGSHHDYVTSLAFSPDGTLLFASGGDDRQIQVWRRKGETGAEFLGTLPGVSGKVTTVTFTPDSSQPKCLTL